MSTLEQMRLDKSAIETALLFQLQQFQKQHAVVVESVEVYSRSPRLGEHDNSSVARVEIKVRL